MKSSTFSYLMCALNLYFAPKLLRKANLLEVARTAKKLLQTPKVAQKLPRTIGKGLYDRSRINVKVELLSTSTFTRDTSYIASILFTRVNFTAQAHKNYAAVEIHPKEHSYLIVLTVLSHLSVAPMIDCKTVGFFLKISKEIGKAWRKSLTRAKRASLTHP